MLPFLGWGFRQVFNAEAVPPPGECAILCPNHGNSLTDAISVVSQSPRMVRLTAKDNLWKDPIFGCVLSGVFVGGGGATCRRNS